MSDISLTQAGRQAKITTPFDGEEPAVLTRFTAIERLSEPFVIICDVIITSGFDTLYNKLGEKVSIAVEAGPARSRHFHGRLWEIAELGTDEAGRHYRLTLKPWASFLDMNVESRTYQDLTVGEIITDVLDRRRSITPQIDPKIGSYPKLEYTVQWQESDFDFLSRQFERHGLYYYFDHVETGHTLVLVDQKLLHTPVPGLSAIEVLPYSDGIGKEGGSIWSLTRRFEVAPIKSTVTDYEFTTAKDTLKEDSLGETKTKFDGQNTELYIHPAGFSKPLGTGRGVAIAKTFVEAARAEAERSSAEGDCFAVKVGATIDIKPQGGAVVTYLITGTTHSYAGGKYRGGAGDEDELTVEMNLIPATVQYRPPLKTPRPRIYGPQTAIVTGTSGEEIETDQYGRIKVKFHWDRVGKQDQTSSCWIRVAQSMAGKTFGGFVLPRIGQEVVVEYLHGDPDQPIVTGAVYNNENTVPYELPANKTRSTFKSQSTPNNPTGFNEFRIEDKNGNEEVFFNAEKDLNSIIDKGDETRTLNKGNRTTTIKEGNETLDITKGNREETLGQGNDSLTISQGNQTVTISQGNRTVKIDMGKDSVDAAQSIELTCGGSSVKLEPAKITLKSVNVEITGDLSVKIAGVMVNAEASGMNTIKGSAVMIN